MADENEKIRWASDPVDRDEKLLVGFSLGELVPQDHAIRSFDELMNEVDWSDWESVYEGTGQPPIHPKMVAGAILYGLVIGLRSSRELEDATEHRVDFQWYLSRRTIDYSTFLKFRKRFGGQLPKLSGQLAKIAQKRLGGQGKTLVIDGTMIRARSDRYKSNTAAQLAEKMAVLEVEISDLLAEIDTCDDNEELVEKVAQLQKELADQEAELTDLRRMKEKAELRDKKKTRKKPTRVPTGDPDSRILQNKDGGCAPNYQVTATVDADTGIIVDQEVLGENNEVDAIKTSVERCTELLGRPEELVADQGFGSGKNLKMLAEADIDAYIPQARETGNCKALRKDLTKPLPSDHIADLPTYGGFFSKEAFVYDSECDALYCPSGQQLSRLRSQVDVRGSGPVRVVEYQGKTCAACSLRSLCIRSKKAANRTVIIDEYASLRTEVAVRMRSDEGQAVYRRRAPAIETVFGHVKAVMNVRYFFYRGLEAVQREWDVVCCAYNVKKLLRATS